MHALADFEGIPQALNESGIRYVVIGGPADVLHGVDWLTARIDLDAETVRRFLGIMEELGFRARIPADLRGFKGSDSRRRWIEENWDASAEILGSREPISPPFTCSFESPIDFEGLWHGSEFVDLDGQRRRVASGAH